ncbi:MAG: zinc-ribbon domain-containing protein [Mariniblastus sp.]|nr:zinc-ribbon domain-containing protein [Mariniblastus sp.]
MSQEFVKLKCPECQKRLKVPGRKASRKIKCPKCETLFRHQQGDTTGPPSPITGEDSNADLEIVLAELVCYGEGQNGPANLTSPLPRETLRADRRHRSPVPPKPHRKNRGPLRTDPDCWLDDPDLPPFEVVDANLVDSTEQRRQSGRSGFFRNAKRNTPSDVVSPADPRSQPVATPPRTQDLGPCIVACKKQPNLKTGSKRARLDLLAWLCLTLFSTLFAFLAGLGSLHLLGLQTDFSMASNFQKILVIAIYGFFFLACLSSIVYLTRRSLIRQREVMIEARQRGIRIERSGQQTLLPYEQFDRVFRQPESELTRLISSLLAGQGRIAKESLVFETTWGKRIYIPGCDDLFTASSLADVLMEIRRRTASPSAPVRQSVG